MVSYINQSRTIELHTVNFGTRMQDLARVVGKSREMNTILLASNCLAMLAFLDIKEMHGLIVTSAD